MPRKPSPRPCFDCECGDHTWTQTNGGYVAMVSPEDGGLLRARAWTAKLAPRTVYAQARIGAGRKIWLLHKLIPLVGSGPYIDHVNHWGLDNRRSNLRLVTAAQNTSNRRSNRTTRRTSRFKGVSKLSNCGRWCALVGVRKNRSFYVGIFNTEIDAARAYNKAARELRGEHAYQNVINE